MAMYHAGNRELQDQFGSRALADRLAAKLWRDRFKDTDKAFIESVGFREDGETKRASLVAAFWRFFNGENDFARRRDFNPY